MKSDSYGAVLTMCDKDIIICRGLPSMVSGRAVSRISCAHYRTDLLDLQPIDFMGPIFRPVIYPLADAVVAT